MLDSDLYLRATADGNLTADVASSAGTILDLGRGGGEYTFWCRVPSDSGTDTLIITLEFDDDSALGSIDEEIELATITGGTDTFPYFLTYRFHTNRRYMGVHWDVTDTGGGVNFGAVEAGIAKDAVPSQGKRP